jgi:hypothetical protein
MEDRMKKVLSLLLFGFIGLSLFAQVTDTQIRQAATTLGVPYEALKQFVQSYQTQPLSSGTIEVDAVVLHQAYQSNRIRADNLYKDKPLRITGVVYAVESDHVNLQGPDIYIGWVSVFFRSTEKSKIANLDVGQTVTFIGIGDSGSGYVEKVKDAILIAN